jgi:hypothetical protein
MSRIHRDVTGWTAFLKQGQTWEITLPNGRIYAIYNERDGQVRPVRPGPISQNLGRPIGRVLNVAEAVIVARSVYRLTQSDDR